jgi:hypothetical protein
LAPTASFSRYHATKMTAERNQGAAEQPSRLGAESEGPESTSGASVDANGVDLTLIAWMKSLSPDERLDALQSFVNAATELADARGR